MLIELQKSQNGSDDAAEPDKETSREDIINQGLPSAEHVYDETGGK